MFSPGATPLVDGEGKARQSQGDERGILQQGVSTVPMFGERARNFAAEAGAGEVASERADGRAANDSAGAGRMVGAREGTNLTPITLMAGAAPMDNPLSHCYLQIGYP